MCTVLGVGDNKIHFFVENGVWEGVYFIDEGIIKVNTTGTRITARILYDLQDAPRGHYNEVLWHINERLKAKDCICLRDSTIRMGVQWYDNRNSSVDNSRP